MHSCLLPHFVPFLYSLLPIPYCLLPIASSVPLCLYAYAPSLLPMTSIIFSFENNHFISLAKNKALLYFLETAHFKKMRRNRKKIDCTTNRIGANRLLFERRKQANTTEIKKLIPNQLTKLNNGMISFSHAQNPS